MMQLQVHGRCGNTAGLRLLTGSLPTWVRTATPRPSAMAPRAFLLRAPPSSGEGKSASGVAGRRIDLLTGQPGSSRQCPLSVHVPAWPLPRRAPCSTAHPFAQLF